ncbi:MAG TPA: hypothetical protein VFF49_07070 [Thermodesulfobacteriota bacterium]|nr:hypothetical protein [Thermodesulfobacteriota bacterium]
MGLKDYITDYTRDDRKRFYVETKKGKIIRFAIQYETLVSSKEWRPVVRYDTVHGFAHKDILDWRGKVIEKVKMSDMDYKKALETANLDIDSNWKTYKQRFLKGGK